MPKTDSQTVIARCRDLAAVSEMPHGTFRTFLSPAMRRCYDVVAEWMKSAGLAVRVDAAGNLRGLRAGIEPGKRTFVMGSHLDTVRDAGAFDGILGVVMAIAVAEGCRDSRLLFDIEVIGFSEEEGVRFGVPFIGSRALVGLLDEQTLQRSDSAGVSIAQAIRDFGLDPANLCNAAVRNPLGFLEFHIEQGPVLEDAGEPLAIVESIAGQNHATVKFKGSANHAGTTPMRLRRDALTAAAEWIVAVERRAQSTLGLVATIGKIDAQPGVSNVIAAEVTMSLDIRHAADDVRAGACHELRAAATEITEKRGLQLLWEDSLSLNTVRMDPTLTEELQAASPSGVRRMASGAGHDAMILAPHIPSAMLFLRTPGGISHRPAENVLLQDVELALQIGHRFIERMSARSFLS